MKMSTHLQKTARFDRVREPGTIVERIKYLIKMTNKSIAMVKKELPRFCSLDESTGGLFELLEKTGHDFAVMPIVAAFGRLREQAFVLGNILMTMKGVIDDLQNDLHRPVFPSEAVARCEPALRSFSTEIKRCVELMERLTEIVIRKAKCLPQCVLASSGLDNPISQYKCTTDTLVEQLLAVSLKANIQAIRMFINPARYGIKVKLLRTSRAVSLMDYPDYRTVFILQTALQKHLVKCHVVRDVQGFDNNGETISLYLCNGQNKDVPLLIARREHHYMYTKYNLFSNNVDAISHLYGGYNILGQLYGSFWGTRFSLSHLKKQTSSDMFCLDPQDELGVVYKPGLKFFLGGEKAFTVVVPALDDMGVKSEVHLSSGTNLVKRWMAQQDTSGLKAFPSINDKKWNMTFLPGHEDEVVMNKQENFKLLKAKPENSPSDGGAHVGDEGHDDGKDDADDVMMQFACVDQNEYILDYGYPFNALQAFGVALTCFANQWFL